MEEEVYKEFEQFDFDNNQNFQTGWSAIANVLDPDINGVKYLNAKIFFFSKFCKPIDLEKYLSWKKKSSAALNSQQESDEKEESQNKHQSQHKQETADEDLNKPDIAICVKEVSLPQRSETYSDKIKDETVDAGNIKSMDNKLQTNMLFCDEISDQLHSTTLTQEATPTDCLENGGAGFGVKVDNCCGLADGAKDNNSTSSKPFPFAETETDEGLSLSLLEIADYIQNDIPIPGLVSVKVQPTNLDPTPSCCIRKPKPWETCSTENVESL